MPRLASPRWSVLFLALVVLAAYLTELQTYLRVADDYPFAARFESGLAQSIQQDWQALGLRRSIGKLSNLPLCGAPVAITGWLCVGLHLATVLLFRAVAARLLRSDYVATFLAVVLGAYPGVYAAVGWACGSYVITMSFFFLAGLWVLLRGATTPGANDWAVAAGAFVLFFLSCVVGEQLIFASTWCGLLAWTLGAGDAPTPSWKSIVARPWVWAPVAAAALYLGLVFLTLPPGMVDRAPTAQFDPLKFNPRTILSVWFYQTRHLDMLQPWAEPGAYRVAFTSWSAWRWAVAAALLLGAWWSGRKFMGATARAENPPPGARTAAVLVAMMLSLSFVHALAGGYSAASRHQYGPMILGLLLVGWCARKLGPALGARFAWRRHLLLPFAAACVFTAWLVTGVYRFELSRHDALLDFLARTPHGKTLSVQFTPPLYQYWPAMRRTVNDPLDAIWVLNCGLSYRQTTLLEAASTDAPTTISVAGERPPFVVRRLP